MEHQTSTSTTTPSSLLLFYAWWLDVGRRGQLPSEMFTKDPHLRALFKESFFTGEKKRRKPRRSLSKPDRKSTAVLPGPSLPVPKYRLPPSTLPALPSSLCLACIHTRRPKIREIEDDQLNSSGYSSKSSGSETSLPPINKSLLLQRLRKRHDTVTLSSNAGGGPGSVEKEGSQMAAVLGQRTKRLAAALAAWRNRGPRAAAEMAQSSGDLPFTKDLLLVFNTARGDAYSLDILALLLPSIRELLTSSKRAGYAQAGNDSLVVIMRRFGEVLRAGVGRQSGIGVDVEAEARAERCRQCVRELQGIRSVVNRRLKDSGLGPDSVVLRDISVLLQNFDS